MDTFPIFLASRNKNPPKKNDKKSHQILSSLSRAVVSAIFPRFPRVNEPRISSFPGKTWRNIAVRLSASGKVCRPFPRPFRLSFFFFFFPPLSFLLPRRRVCCILAAPQSLLLLFPSSGLLLLCNLLNEILIWRGIGK